MPADIIDLTTARLIRDLNTVHARACVLNALTAHQRDACRRAEAGLSRLRAELDRFSARLAHHHRRCERSVSQLRDASKALESNDIDRMIAARDALARRMGPAGVRACNRWTVIRRGQ